MYKKQLQKIAVFMSAVLVLGTAPVSGAAADSEMIQFISDAVSGLCLEKDETFYGINEVVWGDSPEIFHEKLGMHMGVPKWMQENSTVFESYYGIEELWGMDGKTISEYDADGLTDLTFVLDLYENADQIESLFEDAEQMQSFYEECLLTKLGDGECLTGSEGAGKKWIWEKEDQSYVSLLLNPVQVMIHIGKEIPEEAPLLREITVKDLKTQAGIYGLEELPWGAEEEQVKAYFGVPFYNVPYAYNEEMSCYSAREPISVLGHTAELGIDYQEGICRNYMFQYLEQNTDEVFQDIYQQLTAQYGDPDEVHENENNITIHTWYTEDEEQNRTVLALRKIQNTVAISLSYIFPSR